LTKEEAMRWSNLARSALFSVAICCVAMPEAEAIEIFAPPGLAAHVADDTVTQVRAVRRAGGGGYRGGGYRGGGARYAGAYRRGGGARYAGAYRGRAGYGYRGGYGRYGYRGGYARYGYRGGYGYRGYGYGYGYRGYGYRPYGYGYGYGAAALGAAAVAAHHCWINSYGYRVCNYNYY
jgi:hypothetical protein